MKIDRVTLTHIRIPLTEPFRISNGEVSEKESILVGVASEGLIGYGEASPMSGGFYSSHTPESTWDALARIIIPKLQQKHELSVETVNVVLDKILDEPFARAGVETAFWDLEAQAQNKPLYQLLGGAKKEIPSGLAVGIYPTIKELLAAIEKYLVDGYARVKIKIQPGWDSEPLRAIRRLTANS